MKRTALVTAASIAAVIITGTAAVGANIGILSSADDSPVGDLSATTELVQAPVEGVELAGDPRPGPEATSPSILPANEPSDLNPSGSGVRTETFQVDRAGTVVVAVEGQTVQVESVVPAPGWSWTPDDDVPDDSLDVRLGSGSEVLVLHVEVRSNGTLDARIDRPQPPVAPSYVDDDDRYEDDDDRYEDDDHDDEDHDDDEHEGRDDDD